MQQIFYCKPPFKQWKLSKKILNTLLFIMIVILGWFVIDAFKDGLEKRNFFPLIGNLFIIYYLIEQLFFKKKNQFFFEFSETSFRWLYPYFAKEEKVEWNDVQWIKVEENGCTVYKQSSFGKFIDLEHYFVESDSVALKQRIIEEATKRNIKLENAE